MCHVRADRFTPYMPLAADGTGSVTSPRGPGLKMEFIVQCRHRTPDGTTHEALSAEPDNAATTISAILNVVSSVLSAPERRVPGPGIGLYAFPGCRKARAACASFSPMVRGSSGRSAVADMSR